MASDVTGTLATEQAPAPEPIHQLGRPEAGFLVLADISGFTAFTTTTELEHGAEVIGALLVRVIDALSPPLEIQELEGDAVFALGSERLLPVSAPLLPALHAAYGAFRELQRELEADTSCGCRACVGVRMLSLKLVVHHGRFVRQLVAGRSRVAGPDVILAHRLLKNDVEARAYILLTEAAMDHLAGDAVGDGARSLTASYAYFGEVTCFVVTLETVGSRAPAPEAVPGRAPWELVAAGAGEPRWSAYEGSASSE